MFINTGGGEDYLRVDTFNIGGLFIASMAGENDMVHLQDLTTVRCRSNSAGETTF